MPQQPLTTGPSIDPAAALIEKKRQRMEAAARAKDDHDLQRVEDELRRKLKAMLLETEAREQEELQRQKELEQLESARLQTSKTPPSSKRFRSSRRSGRAKASGSGSTRARARLGSSGSMRARRRRRDGVRAGAILAITLGVLVVGGGALLFWM